MLRRLRPTLRVRFPESGASAVEYGLLVSAIAAVIAIVVFALGGVVKDAFQGTCNSVKASVTTANC